MSQSTSTVVFDSAKRIWSGPERGLKGNGSIDVQKSVGENIFRSMSQHEANKCQISDVDDSTLTHGAVLSLGISIAGFLRSSQLDHKTVVGIIANNSQLVLPIAVGCWLNGTVFHPIYTQSSRDVIAHLFGITRPKVIFCDASDYEQLTAACADISLQPEIYTIDRKLAGVDMLKDLLLMFPPTSDFTPTPLVEGPAQTSVVLCSSGTTGIPKCVPLSNLQLLQDARPPPPGEVIFTFSLLNWISGLSVVLITLLSGCARVITTQSSDPETLYHLIAKHRITNVVITPSQLAQLVKSFPDKAGRDLNSISVLFCGGGIVPVPIIEQACAMLGTRAHLVIIYGASEWGAMTTLNLNFRKPKSCGLLMPGYRMRVVDEAGCNLGVGETGELYVHNGREWRGYLGNAAESATTCDADGWFHTGDLGYFDQQGYLFIVDRKKDVLKYRGVDYTPSAIERVVAELPDVIEVCVFGVYDAIDMDRPTTAVVRRRPAGGSGQLSEEAIKQHVAAKLPVHMQLHGGVYFVEALPKTPTGKVLRRQMRDIVIKLQQQYSVAHERAMLRNKL